MTTAVQPLRRKMDPTHNLTGGTSLDGVLELLKSAWQSPSLRCLGCMDFGLWRIASGYRHCLRHPAASELALSLELAGLLYTALQVSAIAGRLIWGGIAGRFVSGNRFLVELGLATPVFALITGSYQASGLLSSFAVFRFSLGMKATVSTGCSSLN